MKEVMTAEKAALILSNFNELIDAGLFNKINKVPFSVQKIVIDLSTAKNESAPYIINIPFKSFYVQDATDVNVSANIRIISTDSIQSSFKIKQNDSWRSDQIINQCSLDWAAQSGKSLTIVFFVDGIFESGSQISVTGGGVSIVNGSSFTQAVQTLAAATAAEVFASDSTRKVGTIQNNSGASIWVGASTVTASGATLGYEVLNGSTYEWRNTAALWAISTAGGDILKMSEV